MSFLPLSALPSSPSSRNTHTPTLLPSPLPHPHDTEHLSSSNHQQPSPHSYHQPPPSIPPNPHPPNFHPLFTLLSTTTTNDSAAPSTKTHHPTIHYVFADDDDARDQVYDPITAAALHVLGSSSSSSSTSSSVSSSISISAGATSTHQDDNGTSRDGNNNNIEEKEKGKKNGKKKVKTKERYVLLDMDGTGTKVVSAQSMSADWAVTGTELGAAPTWDRDDEREVEGRGLMLRIEGVEVRKGEEEEGGEGDGERRLEELVEVYERQMGELRRVVESGTGIGIDHHSS